MTEAEVHELIVSYLELAHTYGESLQGQVEWWMGGSFAVILTAHFAPARMNALVTGTLAVLYVAFSFTVVDNVMRNFDFLSAATQTAKEQAVAIGVDSPLLEAQLVVIREAADPDLFGGLFLVLLPIGCLGYLGYTCFTYYRR